MPAPSLNATVVQNTPRARAMNMIRVATDGGDLQFTPGQFLNVGLPVDGAPNGWVVRAYSVGSAPGTREAEFAVSRVEGGALSPRLCDLAPGARVYLEPAAAGSFTLRDVPAGAPLLVVATGTGTAPFASMLRAGLWDGRSVTVVHGARDADGLAYDDVFRAAPGVRYLPTVTRDPAFTGRHGRVQAVLEEVSPDPASGVHALLCGNPEMIAQVRAWLEARGFRKHRRREPGNLHMEAYW